MRITGEHSRRLLVASGLLAALVVLCVLLFSGSLGSEEKKMPHGNGEVMVEAPTVGTTPAPTAPPPLVIRGREVPLSPGMTYMQVAGTWCNPPCPASDWAWYLAYDPDPGPDPYDRIDSWLVFDQNYNLVQNDILPEDRDLFRPILDALDPPYDPFASPPAYIFIRDTQVPLPSGMRYSSGGTTICEGGPCPPGSFSRVEYDSNPAEAGDSWLVFDENYELRGCHIRPEDQEEFQLIVDALAER